MAAPVFPLHHETSALLNASADEAFAYLDDFRQLSAHMERRSAMMAGSRMSIDADERGGRAVGSKVRMHGTLLGMKLDLEEVVTLREPPRRKAWQTLGARLLVIDQYQLGFELFPDGTSSRLRVSIAYALPRRGPGRWLGRLFAKSYARWCTERMAGDAARHFNGAAR